MMMDSAPLEICDQTLFQWSFVCFLGRHVAQHLASQAFNNTP